MSGIRLSALLRVLTAGLLVAPTLMPLPGAWADDPSLNESLKNTSSLSSTAGSSLTPTSGVASQQVLTEVEGLQPTTHSATTVQSNNNSGGSATMSASAAQTPSETSATQPQITGVTIYSNTVQPAAAPTVSSPAETLQSNPSKTTTTPSATVLPNEDAEGNPATPAAASGTSVTEPAISGATVYNQSGQLVTTPSTTVSSAQALPASSTAGTQSTGGGVILSGSTIGGGIAGPGSEGEASLQGLVDMGQYYNVAPNGPNAAQTISDNQQILQGIAEGIAGPGASQTAISTIAGMVGQAYYSFMSNDAMSPAQEQAANQAVENGGPWQDAVPTVDNQAAFAYAIGYVTTALSQSNPTSYNLEQEGVVGGGQSIGDFANSMINMKDLTSGEQQNVQAIENSADTQEVQDEGLTGNYGDEQQDAQRVGMAYATLATAAQAINAAVGGTATVSGTSDNVTTNPSNINNSTLSQTLGNLATVAGSLSSGTGAANLAGYIDNSTGNLLNGAQDDLDNGNSYLDPTSPTVVQTTAQLDNAALSQSASLTNVDANLATDGSQIATTAQTAEQAIQNGAVDGNSNFAQTANSLIAGTVGTAYGSLTDIAGYAGTTVNQAMNSIVAGILGTSPTGITLDPTQEADILNAYVNAGGDIEGPLVSGIQGAQGAVTSGETLNDELSGLSGDLPNGSTADDQQIQALISSNQSTVIGALQGGLGNLNNMTSAIDGTAANLAGAPGTSDAATASLVNATEAADDGLADETAAGVGTQFGAITDAEQTNQNIATTGAQDMAGNSNYQTVFNAIVNLISGNNSYASSVASGASNAVTTSQNTTVSLYNTAASAINQGLDPTGTLTQAIVNAIGDTAGAAASAFNAITANTQTTMGASGAAAQLTLQAASQGSQQAAAQGEGIASDIQNTSLNAINGAEGTLGTLDNTTTGIINALMTVGSSASSALLNLINTINAGNSTAATNGINGVLGADNSANAFNQTLLQAVSQAADGNPALLQNLVNLAQAVTSGTDGLANQMTDYYQPLNSTLAQSQSTVNDAINNPNNITLDQAQYASGMNDTSTSLNNAISNLTAYLSSNGNSYQNQNAYSLLAQLSSGQASNMTPQQLAALQAQFIAAIGYVNQENEL